ncbi:MAG: excinuclease ABC subunit UvrA [Chitinophagaceae bacterium]|nr:excinuclease ABC subunit UvrA [Chitinophagaceae bacterium]
MTKDTLVNKTPLKHKKSSKKVSNDIFIKEAREHNLKNIDVAIPRNKFTVVTGVSGSGKSSLTIDTLFAEGQRRYAESLSAYARQFVARMSKPDVDYINNLCPAIAIEQKVITRTPRSTVGSLTEIYDYLRLLYARIGRTISPVSGREVKKDDVTDVVQYINKLKEGDVVFLLVPFKVQYERNIREELGILIQKGFSRLFAEGETLRIEELEERKDVEKFLKGKKVFILIDRFKVRPFDEDDNHRIADSVGTAFYEGMGELQLLINDNEEVHFSNRFELDGIVFEEPVPNLFSFNNPYGACPVCEGFSQILGIDPDLVIPDKQLSVYEGAVAPWKGEKLGKWRERLVRNAHHFDFPVHKPIADLTDEEYDLLWKGNKWFGGINDFFDEVERNLYKIQYRVLISRYRGRTLCTACHGYRLRKEALYVKVGGKHIGELSEVPVKNLTKWFTELELTETEMQIARRVLIELETRLQLLCDVGLGYLTLNRKANTLSGGESQRIQLTRNLGSNLADSLYILDEPSIGLHPRDTENLISVLQKLKALGNTLVVVEHDEMMMRKADHIIDMGPLASHLGGEVVAEGNFEEICKNEKSLTGKYLTGKLKVEIPKQRRKWNRSIKVEGARQNNLKNIDVTFPLNTLTVVTGVSGSGKTTLVKQILYTGLKALKGEPVDRPGMHRRISGDVVSVTKIEMVDQNPIGKSARSNPVTYIKAFDEIRELFSRQTLSKIRGYQPGHFSFNVDGGRCDACKGEGEQVVEMQFLADVHLTCEVCKGTRFKEEILEVKYNGKNIHDVLEMSVDDAIDFFSTAPDEKKGEKVSGKIVAERLQPLQDVGLGYIKLGQSSSTLSGGEAQRVKLASFLGKGSQGDKVLFIFDEPTTGLHFHDIRKLLDSLNALIEQGHSVLIIEHNLEVIKAADWIIDLGPGAGEDGGNLVYEGVPECAAKEKKSVTGRFLRDLLPE